jgi:hypothetical protein
MIRSVTTLLLAGLLLVAPPALAQSALCRAAISAAEAEYEIPSRLLLGIGRVESGRRDPATGAFDPWPWVINAEGRGSFFPSREAAIAAVRALQESGVRSIDVGCMQINLRHHPNAFANLEEAFDPLANARYAARFLTSLRQRAGDWTVASGHYHSQTPEFAERYRARLAAVLASDRNEPDPPRPTAAPAAIALAAAPAPSPGQIGPAAAAAAAGGRGLDAYRGAPVPIVGRGAAMLVATSAAAPRPVPQLVAQAAPQPVAMRAPHVVAEVGPAGIANRRLF